MSLGNNIKNNFIPLLEKQGYQYTGKIASFRWEFSKKDVYEKIIAFEKSDITKNSLKVLLEIDGIPTVNPVNLLVFEKNSTEDKYMWEYREESLEVIMEDIKRLLLEFGLPYLEAAEKPDLVPPSSLNEEVISNASSLTNDFHEEISFSGDYSKYVSLIKEKTLERINKNSNPDWDFILQASAALGEYVIENHGGNWDYSKSRFGNGMAVVANVNGTPIHEFPPLKIVTNFWGKPNVYGYDICDKFHRFMRVVT